MTGMVLTELLSLHFVRSNQKQLHQVRRAVPQPQNCWRTARDLWVLLLSLKARLTLSCRAQLSQWENKSNHNRIPHSPHYTIPALLEAVDTTGLCSCLHHEHHVMHAGNFKLHPVFPWQREGLHQQSPGFNLGHPHLGFSCTAILAGNSKPVMSPVSMVPTAESPQCPLCSNMHPSCVTIALIQLMLLKKKIKQQKPCRAMSILTSGRKVSLSQQDNDQNMRLYNSILSLIAPNTQEWPETPGRGERNLFLINGFINKGKRAAVLNIPLLGLINGWAILQCFVPARHCTVPKHWCLNSWT